MDDLLIIVPSKNNIGLGLMQQRGAMSNKAVNG